MGLTVRLFPQKVDERFHDPGHVLIMTMQFDNFRGLENQLGFQNTEFVDHIYEYSGFLDFDWRAIVVVDHVIDFLHRAVCGWVGGGVGGQAATIKVRSPRKKCAAQRSGNRLHSRAISARFLISGSCPLG